AGHDTSKSDLGQVDALGDLRRAEPALLYGDHAWPACCATYASELLAYSCAWTPASWWTHRTRECRGCSRRSDRSRRGGSHAEGSDLHGQGCRAVSKYAGCYRNLDICAACT